VSRIAHINRLGRTPVTSFEASKREQFARASVAPADAPKRA
jgi:hypothetical protein